MTKHTPGPWEVVGANYPSMKTVFGPSFKITAVMWANDLQESDYQVRDADLQLIATAPDLLEALETILDCYNCQGTLSDEQINNALAVITKATGEPE